jgi:hypothetical protein
MLPPLTASTIASSYMVNPSVLTYPYVSNTLAVGFGFGNNTPASPSTYNVAVSKQLSMFLSTGINSGQGKMFGFQFDLQATGATQDSGDEPVRGLIGRVTNLGTGNGKTSAIRVGATGSGSNGSQLVGVDADITIVAGTNNLSSVYAGTIRGTANDISSGIFLSAPDGARLLIGYGSYNAIKYNTAAFRAWLATGSGASVRGFQQLNNGGTETFYTTSDGSIVSTGTQANGIPQTQVANLGLVLIQTQTASSSATIDFTTGLDDTYDSYILVISSAKPATNDVEAWLRVGTGAGPTYQTTNYIWGLQAFVIGAATVSAGTGNSGTTTAIGLSETVAGQKVGSSSGNNFSGEIKFNNPEVADYCEILYDSVYSRATANQTDRITGGGRYNVTGAITAIRFMFSSGNITSGRFSLYGRRKS